MVRLRGGPRNRARSPLTYKVLRDQNDSHGDVQDGVQRIEPDAPCDVRLRPCKIPERTSRASVRRQRFVRWRSWSEPDALGGSMRSTIHTYPCRRSRWAGRMSQPRSLRALAAGSPARAWRSLDNRHPDERSAGSRTARTIATAGGRPNPGRAVVDRCDQQFLQQSPMRVSEPGCRFRIPDGATAIGPGQPDRSRSAVLPANSRSSLP
jgi:hypothetical protein